MKTRTYWILGIIFFLLLVMGGFFSLLVLAILSNSSTDLQLDRGDIAIIEIKGTILDSEKTIEKLNKVKKNDSVKAVVLRIDSPGGGATASQEVYEEVKKLVVSKPVVVSMGTLAASGGYYIACPATKIVANASTITGSVGVLMEHVEIHELLKWAKVSAEILKSGSMKDAGSPFKNLSPEERKYFEDILNNMHLQFQRAVSDGRKISLEEVIKIADGRVFTGEQALQLKLVDQLGNLQDAIDLAASLGGIKGEPTLLKMNKKKSIWMSLFDQDEMEEMIQNLISQQVGTKAFYKMAY